MRKATIKMTDNPSIRVAYTNDTISAVIVKTDKGYKVMEVGKKVTKDVDSYSDARSIALEAKPLAS